MGCIKSILVDNDKNDTNGFELASSDQKNVNIPEKSSSSQTRNPINTNNKPEPKPERAAARQNLKNLLHGDGNQENSPSRSGNSAAAKVANSQYASKMVCI